MATETEARAPVAGGRGIENVRYVEIAFRSGKRLDPLLVADYQPGSHPTNLHMRLRLSPPVADRLGLRDLRGDRDRIQTLFRFCPRLNDDLPDAGTASLCGAES